MKGMELARRYWDEAGRPAFERYCPQVLAYSAVGLAGEGSECFGYDDALSRDHDWGPGFCLWMTQEGWERYGAEAGKIYDGLPQEFLGFRTERMDPRAAGRTGPMQIRTFYGSFLGRAIPPQSNMQWMFLADPNLAAATNGVVFMDQAAEFSRIRTQLLDYYPEDVRRKKLAAHLALAAQAGQYNFPRCSARGESIAAFLSLEQFISHTQAVVFLLNRRYRPYYKWTQRMMRTLPVLGACTADGLEDILAVIGTDPAKGREHGTKEARGGVRDESGQGIRPDERSYRSEKQDAIQERIEQICADIAGELIRQKMTACKSNYLLDHAVCLQQKIKDHEIRNLHLMMTGEY